jgi:hypothetical protein
MRTEPRAATAALLGRRHSVGLSAWRARQVNAIRTILVDEAFGDYNEKTYTDIRNFEEVRAQRRVLARRADAHGLSCGMRRAWLAGLTWRDDVA